MVIPFHLLVYTPHVESQCHYSTSPMATLHVHVLVLRSVLPCLLTYYYSARPVSYLSTCPSVRYAVTCVASCLQCHGYPVIVYPSNVSSITVVAITLLFFILVMLSSLQYSVLPISTHCYPTWRVIDVRTGCILLSYLQSLIDPMQCPISMYSHAVILHVFYYH